MRPTSEWRTPPRHSRDVSSRRENSSIPASRSVNAWVRVYEEDAREAAARADERLAQGDAPTLCGIPIGLKDLYAVAGKPLTASSAVLYDVPDRDCVIWARLATEGTFSSGLMIP